MTIRRKLSETGSMLYREKIFYAFVLPMAVLIVVFGLWPIVLSIQVSFTKTYTILSKNPEYLGFGNYRSILQEKDFLVSLISTLNYTFWAVVLNIVLGLSYALLLSNKHIRRYSLIFQAAVFLPVIVPDIVGYSLWKWMFNYDFGAVNAFITKLGGSPVRWLTRPGTATASLLIAETWKHMGFYVVIFIANIGIFNPYLEEAADLDGVSYSQKVRHVFLPQLRPSLTISVVYAIIQFLKTFTVVMVVTKGGPQKATNFVSFYAYTLFDSTRYGEATAIATVFFLIIIVFSALSLYLNRRSDWR